MLRTKKHTNRRSRKSGVLGYSKNRLEISDQGQTANTVCTLRYCTREILNITSKLIYNVEVEDVNK